MKDMNEILILYLEGELEEQEAKELESKLRTDEALREELEQLKTSLEMVEMSLPPEPDSSYWSNFYSRLQPRLVKKSLFKKLVEMVMPNTGLRLATALGSLAVVFIIAGIFVTQFLVRPAEPLPLVTKSTVRIEHKENALKFVVANHLDSTRLLLQEMVNIPFDDNETLQERLFDTRIRGERLLSNNRTFLQAAMKQGDAELETLLDDLELVLMEISNLDVEMAEFAIPSLQRIIQKKNLLIKIEIINLSEVDRNSENSEREVA